MLPQIKIPSNTEFLANLVLQRTGAFLALGGASALSNWFNYGDKESIANHLIKNNLTEKYIEALFYEISSEVKELRKYIGDGSLDRIVSIGPGNGLVELYLLSEGLTSEILLVDIEDTSNHHHGFEIKGSGYASLEATKSFLQKNTNANIRVCNPYKEALPEFKFTLFISLLSMGFHYPCDEYVSFIEENAAANAMMVFDMRKGIIDIGGKSLLDKFYTHDVIPERKSDRVFLKNV